MEIDPIVCLYGWLLSDACIAKSAAATFNRTLNLDLPVGGIEGAHGVNNTGAATYSIPVKLPPGSNGMAPVISVNYNSQTGNGLCG